MKFGINLLLLTAKIGEAHYPLFAEFKKMGYDGVEIPVFEGTSGEYKALGAALRDHGLGATAVTVMSSETNPISADPKIRQAARDRLRWVLDRCAEFNAEVLCGPLHSALGVFSGVPPTGDERQRGVDFFRDMAGPAAGTKVQLALEYLNRFENYFLTTAPDMLAFVDAIDRPSCGMMWDTFHAHIEEKSVAPLKSVRQRLVHVHLSENDRGTPGTGQVRWKETFAALREINYDRWLVIEAFGRALPDLAAATRVWRDLFDDPLVLCKSGLEFIRSGMGR
ncbi:MAG: sugar phosphate isomerase/epimerase [Methylacidiphilales bacterium]|nr:sugar phosphate isomerase/epimerase [Candidatus Methylacidiphilales bacterium]